MSKEDIKLLKSIVKVHNRFLKGCKKETITAREIQAIENLLKENEDYKKMLNSKIGVDLSYDDYIPVAKIKEIIDKKCMALQHRTKFEQILESEFLRLKGELLEGK